MKLLLDNLYWVHAVSVAPLAGAWIEIPVAAVAPLRSMVAPLAGAWIEIWPC